MHRCHTASRRCPGRKPSPRTPLEEEGEEDAGRRDLLEAFEEDPTQALSDVQTAQIILLSNRRPHPCSIHSFVVGSNRRKYVVAP